MCGAQPKHRPARPDTITHSARLPQNPTVPGAAAKGVHHTVGCGATHSPPTPSPGGAVSQPQPTDIPARDVVSRLDLTTGSITIQLGQNTYRIPLPDSDDAAGCRSLAVLATRLTTAAERAAARRTGHV